LLKRLVSTILELYVRLSSLILGHLATPESLAEAPLPAISP
jgi:hypothetical protein